MTTARQKWKAAYRAARMTLPAAVRDRLSIDNMASDWTKTPRYRASNLIVEVCAEVLRPLGADVGDNPWSRDWRMVNQVEEALRPSASLQHKLGETILNGWGIFFTYRANHALDQRRRAMMHRMDKRGLLIRDASGHVRQWGGFNGLLRSDRYGDFINKEAAA